MKASPLLVQWHEESAPIYSAHFDPVQDRLATAGGDKVVRLWRVDSHNEDRKVSYLSTLKKHTEAVNVVRWSPKGDTLASGGDDGNVILWMLSDTPVAVPFGEERLDEKESWRVKKMCAGMGTEIYDLAWSPDGQFFITGSMDNVARIYNASTGGIVRQIAEHSHYVQGVAWDPLNEYIATQSSDRSVHIYTLKTKSGEFSLDPHHKISKMDLPARRRISSSSPAPPDLAPRTSMSDHTQYLAASPGPSAPGTPQSLMPMNPPPTSHSRRSSFGSSPSIRRSASPAPSLPLPAVMPSNSPRPGMGGMSGMSIGLGVGSGVRAAPIYAGETLASFFRRLTFSPDGSLLFTPAGQYRVNQPGDDIVNTVYIYTRAGLNKPPVAFLPGHKKPSIAVRCSPILYQMRATAVATKNITLDSSSAGEEIPALPEPALSHRMSVSSSTMDPPPFTSAPSPSPSMTAPSPKSGDKAYESDGTPTSSIPPGPPMAFSLPYRIVYGVATQDAVYIYDTQQTKPLCVVSNLHLTSFTDLAWSNDGLTLMMTSSDGFCSCLSFSPGELGQVYEGKPINRGTPINTNHQSGNTTPNVTPVTPLAPALPAPLPRQQSITSAFSGPRPASPARSISTSSNTASFAVPSTTADNSFSAPNVTAPGASQSNASTPREAPTTQNSTLLHQTPSMQAVPSLSAAQSGPVPANVPSWMTPPETPIPMPGGRTHSASSSVSGIGNFRGDTEIRPTVELDAVSETAAESSTEKRPDQDGAPDSRPMKRRRVEPTLLSKPE
ncbi:WD40 repeat-like protein [Microthyrium microscopicum]|uniref:WD40 repeat-like protein n=1 Tax=Microthyrium microscopicum TaxID=703497 RepID=A0A6A6TYA6_9PEZI|nr:WD40 repeat-like protein [Microthyrium microscopicum]